VQRSNLSNASWDAEVVEAAKQVKIHATNNVSFHDGRKSIVGEQGLQLLPGEKSKQMLTSPLLDSQTEMDIMNNLKQVGQGRTTIVVACHLSMMILRCDEIIVLDKGKAVEQRNHQELSKSNAGTPNCWCSQRDCSNWTRQCSSAFKSRASLA
jgi:ABC-type multidrug transport system fused ATPase/permease subunit